MLVGTALLHSVKERVGNPNPDFRDVAIYLTEDGAGAVCGEVRAQSRFEAFFTDGRRIVLRSEVASEADYQAQAGNVCRQAS